MRRVLSGFTLGLLVVLAAGQVPAVALQKGDKGSRKKADPDKNDGWVTNWGKPKNYEPKKFNGYWVWYDNEMWHFRTTGGGKGAPRFQGRIDVIGGAFVNLKGKKGEYGGKNVDRYRFNPERTVIEFDFKTDEGEDGLNFGVDGSATLVKFTLAVNGESHPKLIRVGKNDDHPPTPVFTVPAKPVNVAKK